MGAFVNYFFSGFIMGKIPFPLSPSFRLMLQVNDTCCILSVLTEKTVQGGSEPPMADGLIAQTAD